MLGHLGFSYIGLIYLLMLFIPNIIWTKHQPEYYDYSNENKLLLLFERIGQVAVTCCALIFADFNITTFSLRSIWLIVSFILMILYEIYWVRYFTGEHTLKNFYRSLWHPGSRSNSSCYGIFAIRNIWEGNLDGYIYSNSWDWSYRDTFSALKGDRIKLLNFSSLFDLRLYLELNNKVSFLLNISVLGKYFTIHIQ